jgi:predicted GNAT family N-acyltransferase
MHAHEVNEIPCIPLADMPLELAKRFPRYPTVPVARLGRLAVDRAYRGRKLGGALIWDAVQRSLRSRRLAAVPTQNFRQILAAILQHLVDGSAA